MTKTEKQICDTFVALMKEKPYSAIKVAELTRAAAISRSTFYAYFDSIEDVLQEVEDDFLGNLEDEKDVRPNRGFSEVAKNFSYVRDNLDTFETLTGPNGDPYFATRIGNRSMRILNNMANNRGSNLTDIQLTIINEFSRAGKLQVFRWWSAHRNEVSVNEIIDIFDKMERSVQDIITKGI